MMCWFAYDLWIHVFDGAENGNSKSIYERCEKGKANMFFSYKDKKCFGQKELRFLPMCKDHIVVLNE